MSETANKLEYTEGMVQNTTFSAYSFKNKDVMKAQSLLKSYAFPFSKPIPFIKKNDRKDEAVDIPGIRQTSLLLIQNAAYYATRLAVVINPKCLPCTRYIGLLI